ncbi:hypothetical protein [Paenibacillus camelliae]|uniref:hypothetical protein n=1 Tax=Paenibacillus camelliae TaxID=512410 RepID=UPI00203D8762|nr:hypothetical protein [Paenibacillus camelliae]MCM3635455.1 hypothetical protein [Paenibacillus camelliae]
MSNFRKRDYIISFIIMLGLSLFNIIGGVGSIVGPVVLSIVASLFISFIVGTLTNFIFRYDKKE